MIWEKAEGNPKFEYWLLVVEGDEFWLEHQLENDTWLVTSDNPIWLGVQPVPIQKKSLKAKQKWAKKFVAERVQDHLVAYSQQRMDVVRELLREEG